MELSDIHKNVCAWKYMFTPSRIHKYALAFKHPCCIQLEFHIILSCSFSLDFPKQMEELPKISITFLNIFLPAVIEEIQTNRRKEKVKYKINSEATFHTWVVEKGEDLGVEKEILHVQQHF